MAVKAGDLIQIAYKRRNTTGFKAPMEYLVQQVIPGKSFVIANNGNYTTTLDLEDIARLVKAGRAKLSILSKNEKGGYDRMARMTDEIKEKFIAHFMEKGINDDSLRDAVRTFQLSLARVKAYIEAFDLYNKLGLEKPTGRHNKQTPAPSADTGSTQSETQIDQHEAPIDQATSPAVISSVGERIKQLRKSLDLTQEEFGKRIKVTYAHISKLEASKDNPSEMLIRLAHLEFGVSEEWLINGTGPMFDENGEAHDPEQSEPSHHSIAAAAKKRLVPTSLKGNIANYGVGAATVILYNKQNANLFVDIKVSELPDLIMELDELLSILGESEGITA